MKRRSPAKQRPPGLGGVLEGLSRLLALGGGGVLLAVILITLGSIISGTLFNAPLAGNFELVEIGVAVAVFAFLPYGQLHGGNIAVDLLIRRLPAQAQAWFAAAGDALLALLAALFAWRLAAGGLGLAAYGDISMVLRVPVWWGYVPAVASLGLLSLVSIYTAWRGVAAVRGTAP